MEQAPGRCPFSAKMSIDSTGWKKEPVKSEYPGDNYKDYLKLDLLLGAQRRLTTDPAAHDEHLFIVIHQNFELWFKQILYELSSIRDLLKEEKVCERSQQLIHQRLVRINCIFRIMVQQFEVLETMQASGFASFRAIFDGGASGFQSAQFRKLELTLGIREEVRTCTFLNAYKDKLTEEQRKDIDAVKQGGDIFTLLNSWLSRTPGLLCFITCYKNAVEGQVTQLRQRARDLAETDTQRCETFNGKANEMEDQFSVIFDSEKFQAAKKLAGSRLDYESFMGALMITCYSTEPRFAVPYEILKNFMDLDVFLTKWRFAHAMLVKRMIGGRPGTGGSGGYSYLRSTVSDRYMAFRDLFEVAAYILPPQQIPELTEMMLEEISQIYTNQRYSTSEDNSTIADE